MATILAIACDGGSSPSLTVDELVPAFAQLFCAQMARCCSPSDYPSTAIAALITSPACAGSTVIRDGVADDFNLSRWQDSVRGGRAVLDEAQAKACVDALGKLSCPHWMAAAIGQQAAVPDACRRMIRGTQPLGAACRLNFEHECETGSCAGDVLSVCVPQPTEGQACPSRCEDVFDCRARCAGELRCSSADVCSRNPAPALSSACDGI
jgi:hypothetical protein